MRPVGDGAGSRNLYVPHLIRVEVSGPRAFLVLLGFVFLVAGLAVAGVVDRLTGIGFFVVGAFLVILPFVAAHDD
jgi:hypothetical protein